MQNIKFSDNWPKLENRAVGDDLTTIRWYDKIDYYMRLREEDVRLIVVGFDRYIATIKRVYLSKMKDLTDEFIKADTRPTMTRENLYDMMENWYGRKPDWKDWDSLVVVIHLKIVEVLDVGSN